MAVTSFEIKNALAKRHRTEFFITECKNGPTQFGHNLKVFDALAIYKSWTKPRIRIYEVKVSRSDFLADKKFCTYLPYCHEMYFIVPAGMVDRTEIPAEIGLMYYNPEKKTTLTKKEATYREIEVDTDLLFYIFMNRVKSQTPCFENEKVEFFKAWLDNKESNTELGYRVKSRLIGEVARMESELDKVSRVRDAVTTIEEIKTILHDAGYRYFYSLPEEIKRIVTQKYPKEIEAILYQAKTMLQTIQDMKKRCEPEEEEEEHQS